MLKKTLAAVVATTALLSAGAALADKPGAGWITIEKAIETAKTKAGYVQIYKIEADNDGYWEGEGRKAGLEVLHFIDREPLDLPSDSKALHLIMHIRDEAHRFAITAHRKKRDKRRSSSVLEAIPGLGEKRRRDLLKHFGGLQELNRASIDEIAKAPGISKKLAESIYAALHSE